MQNTPPTPGTTVIAEGDWTGWTLYQTDPYENLSGPFYARWDAEGRATCGFRAEPKHNNGSGFMHGGALLTFADFALFCIGREALAGSDGAVTASLNAEFVDAARAGELIEATGEVVRAGGSLVFLRGLVTTGGRTLMSFSAVLKKTKKR